MRSGMSKRPRSFVAIVAVAAGLLAGCGGGSSPRSTADGPRASRPAAPSQADEATTSTSTSSAAPVGTAPGAHPGVTSAPPTGATPSGAPRPAAPGAYRYRQSGSSTFGGRTSPEPAEGTLTVDADAPDATQVFHRFVDPGAQPDDTTYVFRPDGIFVTRQVVRATNAGQTITVDCRFDPPVAALPWPADIGRTFSGHGDCGNVTVDVTGSITGRRDATVDGRPTSVIVVHVIARTHGQIESTLDRTDWLAPGLSLSVHVEQHVDGRVGVASFRSDLVADLESARPGG